MYELVCFEHTDDLIHHKLQMTASFVSFFQTEMCRKKFVFMVFLMCVFLQEYNPRLFLVITIRSVVTQSCCLEQKGACKSSRFRFITYQYDSKVLWPVHLKTSGEDYEIQGRELRKKKVRH